ncbi:MAG: type IV pilus secretin PilQ, partial [Acidobacteria bacterium]|nr:type IV pilus secretin PilQ [Acidobacteriota bacterium]
MRFGKVAILLVLAAAALRCSGHQPVSDPGLAAFDVPAAVVISQIDHMATPSGTEVVLRGNYPFSYTSYQPDPTTLVLELLDVQVQGLESQVAIDSPQVETVRVTSVESVDGGVIAKFEFQNVFASQHSIRLDGNDLVIDFPSLSDIDNAAELPIVALGDEPEEDPDAGLDILLNESGEYELQTEPLAGPAEDADFEPLPGEGESVESGDELDPFGDGELLEPIEEDSAGRPREDDLEPLPLDVGESTDPELEPLPGMDTDHDAAVEPEVMKPDPATSVSARGTEPLPVVQAPAPQGPPAKSLLGVSADVSGDAPVIMLRADGVLSAEHFELKNPPRLVIDLPGVINRAGTNAVPVGSAMLSRVRVAQFASKPRPVARVVLDMSGPHPYAIIPTSDGLVIDFSGEAVRHAVQHGPVVQQPIALPLAAETPEVPGPMASDLDLAPDVDPSLDADPLARSAANPLLAMGEVRIHRQPNEVAFRADPGEGDGTRSIFAPSRFSSRAISDTGPKYVGKPISLNFKDADLKDVFRLFHEITGFNIILDPAVSGNLTIVLENVPDDQALDIILKNNGLDKVFENNVIRIATTQKLASEAAARRALIEAKELEEEPITFTRSLSYAKAAAISPIIKKIMSKRGDVIMDDRTNTLIITDLKNRKDSINRLIDTLDEQTAQVVIEARIVETDREFERDFGIRWGVRAEATAAKGTQTNLDFPHTATLDYDVALPAAASASTLGLTFGNVLDSVNLDVQLDAFELNGDVKVLSSPRIATQNNQKATIEQGVQIPVVSTTATQINVEFISASLKLEVTPQITKEGTVIMDVMVDNSSPDFVNRVGDVPPIITEKAQTQILVPDGGTAVIGGIFKLNSSITRASVPGLSKIPGIGWLFKNKSINRKNTELLIFITPRIT